ncbi:MAG: sugar transferase [Oscillatoriales cyanobacterium SM2_2_1]|nr:sugar transferase [Oscillatoriales cyanobacterium SM2_2_1]
MQDIRAGKHWQLARTYQGAWGRSLIFLAGDILGLMGAWRFAVDFNRPFSPLPSLLNWGNWVGIPGLFWVYGAVVVLLFAHHNFYGHTTRSFTKQAAILCAVYLSSLVIGYFYDPELNLPRSLFIPAWLGSVVTVMGLRLFLTLVLDQFAPAQIAVFLIAPSDRLESLAELINRRTGHQIIGQLPASAAHTPEAIAQILHSGAQEVIAEDLPEHQLASRLYWQLRRAGIGLRLIPSSLTLLHRRGNPEVFAGMPTIHIDPDLFGSWEYLGKRLLDFTGALIGLIVLSPVFVAIALTIKITAPGSIFYSQERVGLHGQVIRMWKFRSMYMDADRRQAELERHNESQDGITFKLKHDPRIIPIGHLLRRTSLDELPQLLNVLCGQMSLVGPRPLPLRDVARFADWHHTRHVVVPGMTGMWQISGRSHLNRMDDMARLDLFYIDHWSLNLDLDILVETLRIVLFGRGAY